ncbi:hypothetical protein PHYSODRAFT_306421 [Phytophthora sojae]|uniref:Transmembrane protein n=1 Tax=Phytophthora sojae (strain P6497) TaxID=1094619 RepID=G5A9I4_PHYSP|nr:hypothetical protein PHYSODRAFT_306421 [Phytophthora sojae]EGZ08559.1 hypothetical protein PHYSODRAFT_306421 [Phytophthora sojae]|eukprot:XP_009536731.1 hypothetical protein PHYSODRAFT_306421 [Phytophthora sojae]
MGRKRPAVSEQSLRAQAEAKYEVHLAERRQLEQERMSSYTDDAFECESPHAMLASSRGQRPGPPRGDVQTSGGDGASPYLVVDNIGRLRVDSVSDSDAHDDVAYGELAQPRPEIILRWKRFAVLVVLTAAVMSAIAAWLREGFVVDKNVPVDKAEDKADMVNSYIGLIMGFVESLVGLGVEEIFPVFIVYLHNLRWYPGDDPATKRQSKFKKFSLTIFIPAVMMAVGSSMSAIQANQKDDNNGASSSSNSSTNATTTRFLMREVTELGGTGLADSILKTALERRVEPMQPLDTSRCTAESELLSAQSLLAAAPKAVFGFPLQEWSAEFGNGWHREEATQRYEVAYPGAVDADRDVQLSEVMPLTTAYELWTQGKSAMIKSVRATSSGQTSTSPPTTGELLEDVLISLRAAEIPLAETAALDASFERTALSSLMDMDVMTVKVPLRAPTNSSVVCGETSCALLEPQLSLGHRLPRKQIGMMQMPGNCSLSAECEAAPNAAFLYGFTTVTGGTSDGTGEIERSLVLSFAQLSWRFDSAAYECDTGTSCQVLHHQLDDGDRHLVVPKQLLPAQLQVGSFASPVSLVQLMEPKTRLGAGQASRFATLERLDQSPQYSASTCSPAVDTYLQYVDCNHFYLGGDMVDTMAASALLFLFQNAQVLDTAPGVEIMMTQRRLADTNSRRVKVFLTNTKVGNISTWTGCAVLLLLTVLTLVLPNERARLSPPRGGNARAERFVAVQTEQIYPNLIYKKRFLIGKTGEEIKFGEFAVESVGLHHKMEEDEQIYI